jgi:hypothetical protein
MNSAQSMKQSLQSDFPITPDPFIAPNSNLFFLGSCFSDEMSQRFHDLYIPTHTNPFGTLFSPQAIRKALEIFTKEREIQLHFASNAWHFLDGANRFQNAEAAVLQNQLDQLARWSHQALLDSHVLFITLGSAHYYQWNLTQESVANCHKIPQKEFQKACFKPVEVEQDLQKIEALIRKYYPHLTVVYTISPVRHLRDGVRENSLSKSILKVALNDHISANPHLRYFPSFEIFNEELRDFRFFKPDLMHPNPWATDYIFTRLIETHAQPALRNYLSAAEERRKVEAHKSHTRLQQLEIDSTWDSHREALLQQINLD